MGIRRTFADWKKLEANSDLTSGEQYLCCMADPEKKTGTLHVATYYDKGDVVRIAMDRGYEIKGDEPTPEERLLRCIFGVRKPYTVPEDGLYVMTADYGVDEKAENGAFEGCTMQLVQVGNRLPWGEKGSIPAHYAERPAMPEGLHESEPDMPRAFGEALQARFASLTEAIASKRYIADLWKGTTKGAAVNKDPIPVFYKAAEYEGTTLAMANALVRADEAICALAECFPGAEDNDEAIAAAQKIFSCRDGAELDAAIGEFMKGIGMSDRMIAIAFLSRVVDMQGSFYEHRDRIYRKGGTRALSIPYVMQTAMAEKELPWRVWRCVKLWALGAPDIIKMNELRMLCDIILAIRCSGEITHVDPERFEAIYGIRPDGARGSVHCALGDNELNDMEEEEPEDETTADDGIPTETEDEYKERIGYPEPEDTVASYLTRKREECGYSLEKAAKKAGVRADWLKELEGGREPDHNDLDGICDVLDAIGAPQAALEALVSQEELDWEPEPGVDCSRYGYCPSPNFLFKAGRYAIWDIKEDKYHRDADGAIPVFENVPIQEMEELERKFDETLADRVGKDVPRYRAGFAPEKCAAVKKGADYAVFNRQEMAYVSAKEEGLSGHTDACGTACWRGRCQAGENAELLNMLS